jgi:hypothetical protein
VNSLTSLDINRSRNRALAGYLELLARKCDPSEEMQALIRRQYAEKTEDFRSCELLDEYEIELAPQGSNSLGTVTPPLDRPGGEIDLDMVVIVKALRSALEARELHRRVGEHLESFYYPRVGKLRLGWAIDYAMEHKFHFDVIPVIPIDHPTAGKMLGATLPEKNSYKPTNPQLYQRRFLETARKLPVISEDLEYFEFGEKMLTCANRAQDLRINPLLPEDAVLARPLQRMTQISKMFRDVWFHENSKLARRTPSIVLTTLLWIAYEKQVVHRTFATVLDVLQTMVDGLTDSSTLRVEETREGRRFYLMNPTVPDENLVSRWNEPGESKRADEFFAFSRDLQAFVRRIQTLEGNHRIQTALENNLGETRVRPLFNEIAESVNPTRKRPTLVFDSVQGIRTGVPAVGAIVASTHTHHGIH